MKKVVVLCVWVLSLGAGCGSKESKGCHKDTECKGDRICEKGRCVAPPKNLESESPKDSLKKKNVVSSRGPSSPGGKLPSTAPMPQKPKVPKMFGGLISLKVCQNGKCKDLNKALQGDPSTLFKLFGNLGFQGGLGGPSGGAKLKICAGGQCVDVDKDFGKNPQDLFRMFGMIGGLMLGGGGHGGVFGGPFSGGRSLGGGASSRRPKSLFGPNPSVKRDPSGKISYTSVKAIIKAGNKAVGRVAKLKNLEITVLRNTQVVLKGSNRLLVVLDIPPKLSQVVAKLRNLTSKVTVTFYITQAPLPNLLRGEILKVN